MTYRSFSGSSNSQTISNLFHDDMANGEKQCILPNDMKDMSRHWCTHYWYRVDRKLGDCSSGYDYQGNNLCQTPDYRAAHFGCEVPETYTSKLVDKTTCDQYGYVCDNLGANCSWSCVKEGTYKATVYDGSCVTVEADTPPNNCCKYNLGHDREQSEQISGPYSENYELRGVNFANGSASSGSADCSRPPTNDSGNSAGYPTYFSVGTRYNDSYTVYLRAACNYLYRR
jgi:hypothetical protein